MANNEHHFEIDIDSKMVAKKEALIADFVAYKMSLIYEVVTGKREVA